MITLSDSTFRAGSRLTFGGYGMTVDMIGCQLLDTSLWLAVDRARLANTVIAPPAGAPGITFGDDFRDDRGRQLLIDHVTIATYDDTDAVRIKADALGSAQVYRSVLVSRTQAQEPGEIVFRPPFAFIEVVESYAQILGLPPEQLPGSGLLSEPPALVGPTTGPALTADALRPSLGSSAIDAGTSAQLLGGLDITTDIRGLLRDSTPDVGAFEYVAFLDCPADVNADARLDIDDFSAFVALFFATAAAADINRDSVFDIDDFSAFIDQFFAGC
ncbi:MAG: GC-type dockerin domain-anchored protein [Planctomycetota bacterium]